MSKQTETNLLIVSSLPRLYQHLLTGVATYQELGNRTLEQIKAAHAFRQADKVKELSEILINIPIREYQLIAQYYLVWYQCRQRKYQDESLEKIVEQSQTYKAKALLSRAAIDGYQGKTEPELYFSVESLKASFTISDRIEALRGIALVKAKEGFHRSSLKDLEHLLPLVKYAEPIVYFDYLNSYAVELGEAGRTDEARNISQVVINSPFAFAYPEWQQTAQELQPANRSFAAIESSKIGRAKLLQMPEFERGESSQSYRSASVTNIQDWKADMGRKKKSDYDSRTYKDKSFEERDRRELLLTLVDIGTNKRMTDDKLYKVIVYMDKVLNEPDQPQEPEDDPGA